MAGSIFFIYKFFDFYVKVFDGDIEKVCKIAIILFLCSKQSEEFLFFCGFQNEKN